ncbi:hypothetical protein KC19_VG042600, partial [Ceratodon purpureus]
MFSHSHLLLCHVGIGCISLHSPCRCHLQFREHPGEILQTRLEKEGTHPTCERGFLLEILLLMTRLATLILSPLLRRYVYRPQSSSRPSIETPRMP